MLRLALLPVLCLFACTSRPQPEAIHTVEVEKPAAETPRFEPPTPKVEAPREAVEAPTEAALSPVEAWALVTLDRERPNFPWVRAAHKLGGHLELPRGNVSEPMVMGPVVVITREGVYFAGRRVARIEYGVITDLDNRRGPMITALKEPLRDALRASTAAESSLPGPRLVNMVALFADAGTPFEVIVAVIYTSGQAGAAGYQLAVDRPGKPTKQGSDVLQIRPPTFISGQTRSEADAAAKLERTQMVMEMSPTDVRIGRHVPYAPERSAWIERVSVAGDREAAMRRINALARAMVAGEQWGPLDTPTVLFSADSYVPLELVVAALSAVGGADCDVQARGAADHSRCLFVNRVVHAGRAAPPELAGP